MCTYGTKPLYIIVFLRFLILCQKWRNKQVYIYIYIITWWCHQMEIFSALLAICAGNSPVGEVPAQRPVTRSFDVFFDLCLNKRSSKQSRDCWFEAPSRPLWCHCNDMMFDALNVFYKINVFVPSPIQCAFNALMRRQNGRNFADDTLKCI